MCPPASTRPWPPPRPPGGPPPPPAPVAGGPARRGLTTAVLSGGVFQNRILLEATVARLEETGLRVLVPERVPPNDGGIAYGQAAVAAARLALAPDQDPGVWSSAHPRRGGIGRAPGDAHP